MAQEYKEKNRGNQNKNHPKKATAPYNFVSFASKVLWAEREENGMSIQKDRLTGEISYHFTAETPIFVGGTEEKSATETKGTQTFYRDATGRYGVPGSSMRGVIRKNMQILGFDGVHQDIHDYHILFRNVAGSKSEASSTYKYYKNVLDIETKNRASVAKNTKAGYLTKVGGDYVIYPSKKGYIRLPLESSGGKDRETGYCSGLLSRKNNVFHSEIVQYRGNCRGKDGVLFQKEPVSGYETGTFFCTGKAVSNINAKYLFTGKDKEAAPIGVQDKDILSYKMDYEKRIRVDQNKNCKQFWALPKEGEEKPVFYVELDGRCYFGMTQFLRIPHQGSIFDGLPEAQKEEGITFVKQILGTGGELGLPSKVYFEDAITENPQKMEPFSVILGEPIPSFSGGYVKDGKHYSSPEFEIRGFKEYWMKEFVTPAVPEKIKVASHLAPLGKGTKFTGKIRFKNMKTEELGLLLWALTLEKDSRQAIGMGKPLGMGRVKLEVDQVKVFDMDKMYQSLSPSYQSLDLKKTIETYHSFCKKHLGILLRGEHREESITEFFYIRKKILSSPKDLKELQDMGFNRANLTDYLDNISQLEKVFAKNETVEAPVKELDLDGWKQALVDKYKK